LALPGSSATNPVWKIIWKLKVPSKVKKFIWRALHGILPLKSILINRHIGDSGECPICHLDAEDILHLLFKCEPAKAIWESMGLSSFITDAMVTDRSGSGVLEHIFRLPDNLPSGFSVVELKELVAVTCWYLWWIRRRRTHGDSVPPIYRCKLSILAISANAAKVSKPPSTESIKWSKPDPRWLKLNVDASFHVDKFAGAAGAIIRDFEGSFVAAKCVPLPHVESAAMAETLAMRLGLELGRDIGCNRLIAESDSTDTIEACNGESRWWNQSSAIYAECVDLIPSIGSVSFKFCPREANQVAHNIARFCFSNNISCNWVDEPPSFILDSLTNDVTVL
jgi:ribonuclease HI